jgi:Fe-S oxidoreductase
VGIEHLQLLIGAKRAQALAIGTGMVATGFLQTVEQYGNPFSAPRDARKELIANLSIPVYEKGKTEYLLWLGCTWTYNEDARSSLEAMLRILNEAKVSYGVLEEESCSGHHSRRQGEEMQFQTLATENIERLEENEVTKIIAPCPHCLHTFRQDYPGFKKGFAVDAQHHSQFLAQLVESGKIRLRGSANGKVLTYHDPCYLGRYENVYDAPRRIIESTGQSLTELPRRRETSFCCGGGSAGFVREAADVARRVDQERKDEITASGANLLVTGCPECKMMLAAAVDETMDVAELVASAMVTSNGS